MRAFVVALLIVLAGCSTPGADTGETGEHNGGGGTPTFPPLAGFVFDPAVIPIEGATISIASLGLEVTTDADGVYAFEELPTGDVLVVVVQAEGYKPASKSLSLDADVSVLLNFTLERIPIKIPTHNTLTYKGIVGCGAIVKGAGTSYRQNCPGGVAVDNKVWEFYADADLAGAVIEVVWEAQSETARHLNLTVQTVGYGDLDEILFSQEYGSILRGQISSVQAARFYSDGGLVRVTVDVGRNTADEEVDIGAGFAVQQEFEVFATLFYVAPPPADFTIDA